jgi:cell division protein FtsQ
MEQFYRPAAAASVRAKMPQETAAQRSAIRKLAEQANGESEDREEDAFLRARRRVPVRRGFIPTSRAGRIAATASVVFAIGALLVLGIAIRNFLRDDPRFRIAASSSIQIMGNSQVTRSELLSVFGSDLGRNIFFIPLGERRAALQELPWVEHATVMRLLPDQLRVAIVERTPIAFVRHGNTIGLVDAHGVLLHLPPAAMVAKHYSFPVVSGISTKDPPTVRATRMHLYQRFINDLDSGGDKVSSQLSEVDLSDPEDVWALLPAQGSDIQVHFGDSDFLARYRSYQQHLPGWRQQYPHLASVDMRYENLVVLDMAQPTASESGQDGGAVSQHHAAPSSAKHASHTAGKPATKSPRAGRAQG